MTDYSTSLLRSVTDRAWAFRSYVQSLQSTSSRSDDGYAAALEMFDRYGELVVRQIQEDWSRQRRHPDLRHNTLKGWAKEFFEREAWFDQRFARSSQGDLPAALLTIARRELRSHGLDGLEPVLTVGPPDNFETHEADLAEYLFGTMMTVRTEIDLADLPMSKKLTVISVPYIEGTRALWYPIALGHEIGHVRIEADRAMLSHLETRAWIHEDDPELVSLVDESDSDLQDLAVQNLRQVLQNWADEILCDLNAVRLFSAGGLSAIAEFLSVWNGPSRPNPESPTSSHPPLSLRISMMLGYLRYLGEVETASTLLEPWADYAASKKGTLQKRAAFLASRIEGQTDALLLAASRWGEPYRGSSRQPEIEWLRDQLLDGIPGGTHSLSREARGSAVSVADVVNAAWRARAALDEFDDPDTPTPVEPDGRLVRSTGSNHQKRVTVDKLGSKAIDSLEFARLWETAGGAVVNLGDVPETKPEDITPSVGAVLSRTLIEQRLASCGNDRLVVTPLLSSAIQDAGIDIRLSPDFIVFRRSATAAFDPLNEAQDPRAMQESVSKGWGNPFILHPGEHVLASTLEYIGLPLDVAAQVVTRSSYGRLGLITATAVQVQPGSHNCITLELVNHGSTPVALTAGSRIAQLILFQVSGQLNRVDDGKYLFPVGPEFSRVQVDVDAEVLRALGRTARPNLSRDRAIWSEARSESLSFVFRGGREDALLVQQIAEGEAGDVGIEVGADLGTGRVQNSSSKLGGSGADVVAFIVAGTAALKTVSSIVFRLVRIKKAGVVVTIMSSGAVELKVDKRLPQGALVLVKDEGASVEVLLPAGSTTGEIAEGIARVRRHNRRDPRAGGN